MPEIIATFDDFDHLAPQLQAFLDFTDPPLGWLFLISRIMARWGIQPVFGSWS